jgi:hypothetical protein
MISISWFALGGAAWTASEYVIHRFVGHGPKRAPKASLLERLTPSGLAAEFNREHLAHHTDPSYFAPTSRKLLAAVAVIPTMGAALTPFVGPRRALSFALGFGAVYGAYELMHRRIHTHAPRGAYGKWMRRHHLYHHHRTPKMNHGVTTAIWDHVFGTHSAGDREQVRVPRKSAPAWMVDPLSGEVRAEYAADYELVPRRAETAPVANAS